MTIWKLKLPIYPLLLLGIILAILTLTACDESTITPTSEIERAPSLEASITVAPIIPTEGDDAIGRSDPTMAGLAAEGQPSPSFEFQASTVATTPQAVSISIIADDGQVLDVMFYRATVRPAPTVILLHDTGENSDVWEPLAPQLRNNGFNVAVPTLRFTSDSPSASYWQQSQTYVRNIVENIFAINNLSTGTIIIGGAGSGANLGLISCANLPSCIAAVAISPQNNILSLDFGSSISDYQGRSVMLISADDDSVGTSTAESLNNQLAGDHTWQRYSGGGRGTALLLSQPDLPQRIADWVRLRATS